MTETGVVVPTYTWSSESHQKCYHRARLVVRGDRNEYVPDCSGIRLTISLFGSSRSDVPANLEPCSRCFREEIARSAELDQRQFVRVVAAVREQDRSTWQFLIDRVAEGWPPALVWWVHSIWPLDYQDQFGPIYRNRTYVRGVLGHQLDRQRRG